jgi:hypothetical protein
MLDYGVAGTLFAVGFSLLNRHRPAATLALVNGAMILGMSMLTDYPGGVWRKLNFKGHRSADTILAAFVGIGPVLFGFPNEPETRFFYGQAMSEAGVIAMTDWNAA